MRGQDDIQRTVLPIPDRPRTGLATYDAKDPDTASTFGGGLGKGGTASLYVDGKKAGALQGARLCSIHN